MYLNWQSNHHLDHKRSAVRTLLQRAEAIPSTEEYKKEELAHVKQALAANGYKPWIFKIPKKKERPIEEHFGEDNDIQGSTHCSPLYQRTFREPPKAVQKP